MNKNPLVSIIVPTKNSAEYLKRCLDSLNKQTYKKIEILVIDKASTDKTLEIAEKMGAKTFIIDKYERCDQMNFGAQKAQGNYVYIVGSDFVLEPDVVRQAVEKCENGTDALYIHNTSDPTISFWSMIRKFERDMYKNDDLNVAARFFKKTVWDKLGGYNEKLVAAEDYDLQNRLVKAGYKVDTIEAQEIHLGEPKTLKEVWGKHYYYGQTLPDFLEANKERGLKQLSPIRPAFIKNWKEFLLHPVLALGFLFYQFVKYLSGFLGLITVKIKKANEERHNHL